MLHSLAPFFLRILGQHLRSAYVHMQREGSEGTPTNLSRRKKKRGERVVENGWWAERGILEVVVEGLGAILAVLEELRHPSLVAVRDGVVQGLPANHSKFRQMIYICLANKYFCPFAFV